MLTTHEYKGITGAIDGTGKVEVILYESAANTEKTYQFLEFLRSQRPRHQIHIMLDNASFHHAKAVKETVDNLSINLHFQAPHSPFLNDAEEIWRQVKQFLRGKLFKTMNQLKTRIQNFFASYPKLNINLVQYLL